MEKKWTPPGNLQKFPTIVRVKSVQIPVNEPLSGVSNQFFPYDAELNNSWIKGIRLELRNLTWNSIVNSSGTPYNATYNLARSWFLNLVTHEGKTIVSDYPLNGLASPNATATFIRRFNLRCDLSKSYIRYALPATPPGIVHFSFSVYYKQIKPLQ